MAHPRSWADPTSPVDCNSGLRVSSSETKASSVLGLTMGRKVGTLDRAKASAKQCALPRSVDAMSHLVVLFNVYLFFPHLFSTATATDGPGQPRHNTQTPTALPFPGLRLHQLSFTPPVEASVPPGQPPRPLPPPPLPLFLSLLFAFHLRLPAPLSSCIGTA